MSDERVETGDQDPTQAPGPANNEDLPAKPSIKVPPPASELGADVDLERRWANMRGQVMAYRNGMEQYTGSLEQRVHTLTASLTQANATIKKLEGVVESLQGEMNEIPGLREKVGLADELQQQVDRLELLMTYPQVVGATQVTQVEGEDGAVQEVRENPWMDLLMSSKLTGDAFKASVEKLIPTLGAPKEPAPPPAETGSVTPVPPAEENKIATLWNRYNEAMSEGDRELANRVLDEIQGEKYK